MGRDCIPCAYDNNDTRWQFSAAAPVELVDIPWGELAGKAVGRWSAVAADGMDQDDWAEEYASWKHLLVARRARSR